MEQIRITFRYRLGQTVWWEGQAWVIVRRRWEEGTVARVHKYGLVQNPTPAGTALVQWAYEPDVTEGAPR